jgi:hypothetical protein
MPEDRTYDLVGRRLALYAYLEPLLSGRRVLEIRPGRGGDAGESAAFLRSMGARVVSIDADTSRIDDRFEVVIVPEGEEIARRAGAVAALRKLLADGGRVIVGAANVDRVGASGSGDGIGYYDLHGALASQFSHVQMLGVTPFIGMGVVEFEGAVDGLRIDSRLVKEGSEPPAAYVAVAGTQVSPGLGYALVQLPFGPLEAHLAAGGAGLPTPSSAVLREEIEDLRGRLRRAAEDRAALDTEISTLRRALTEADESVINLTKRTADEMSAMAARLGAGLRGSVEAEPRAGVDAAAVRDEAERLRVRLAEAEARASAAEQRLEEVGGNARQQRTELEDALERLRLADNELQRARRSAARFEGEAKAAEANADALAERDDAIAARDERIARLESEKQDLIWRVAELEDKLTATIARAVRTDAARAVAGQPDARPQADFGATPAGDAARDDGREKVLDQFHRAAAAHVGELTELKASVAEQSALVAELEDAVRTAEARAQAADADATTLRKTAKDLEESDRSRRSRLAELEGKLLRFEHERRSAPPPAPALSDEERASWARERDQLRAEIEKLAAHARGKNGHAAEKLDAMAAGVAGAPPSEAAASRLENTLGNYRQRASRLRDELEGIRRRFDALSPSEIAGFLQELGEDLEELGK